MKGPDLSRYKRSWGFAIAVLMLMGVFFLGYYFYYIPFNRQGLQKDAFLTLENISHNLETSIDDRKVLYQNYLNPKKLDTGDVSGLQDVLDKRQIEGVAIHFHDSNSNNARTDTSNYLVEIRKENLIFASPSLSGVAISLPVSELLTRLLKVQKNEFFRSFILVHKDQDVVYKDGDIGLRSDIEIDTLLSKNFTSYVSGVKDIRMEDDDYKLFYYPFQVDEINLVLCGFIKTDIYQGRLRSIPVSFIYPLVVCFLLLLIFLPILKFYLMGVNEQMKFSQLVYFVLSLFVGSSLLTLTIIQVLLMFGADAREEKDLRKLSNQIKSAFYAEIRQAYQRVKSIDSFMLTLPDDSIKSFMLTPPKDSEGKELRSFSPSLFEYMRKQNKDTGMYYNFSQVQWVDPNGMQIMKGDFRNTPAVGIKVDDRQFFTVYRDRRPLPIPGVPGSGFGMEPLVSRTTGEFMVVISRRSGNKDFVVGTSNQMYSISDVIMTPGYGFSIIDGDGNVLIHSDSVRNLRENFFQKLVSYRGLKEVVSSRQQRFFSEIFFYGKNHSLNIEPLDRMPFYLVTFYDKGYVFPVNMRILIFSLLGCLISYFLCIVVFILLFSKRLYKFHLLYSPMRLFEWAFPQRRLSNFYQKSWYFLAVYGALLLVVLGISGRLDVSDAGIIVLAAISPFNIVAGLILIHNVSGNPHVSRTRHHAIHLEPLQLAFNILIFLLLLNVFLLFFNHAYPMVAIIFQAAVVTGLTIYWLINKKQTAKPVLKELSDKYYTHYSRLVLLMIINLSIIPAGIFTWYPHNQEIIQTVKKQQLYLATKVQERRPKIEQRYKMLDSILRPPPGYIYDRQFKSGIYSINKDSIFPAFDSTARDKLPLHDNFYFGIADAISNNYYDPQSYPALSDNSNDNAWFWNPESDKFEKLKFRSNMNADTTGLQTNTISILSSFPPRYMFVVLKWKGLILVVVLLAALLALYIVIKTVSSKIFLRKYVQINLAMNKPPTVDCNSLLTEEEYVDSIKIDIDHEDLELAERKVIELLNRHKWHYKDIWNQCSEKEKYLLFDFAHDGLMNYNNTIEIYNLIDKGILLVNNETDAVTICSRGFRAYIILQKGSPEMVAMQKIYTANSNWQSFRIPFMIVLLAIAGFIFFTQEATFQKIAALVTGISTISTLLLKLPFTSKTEVKA